MYPVTWLLACLRIQRIKFSCEPLLLAVVRFSEFRCTGSGWNFFLTSPPIERPHFSALFVISLTKALPERGSSGLLDYRIPLWLSYRCLTATRHLTSTIISRDMMVRSWGRWMWLKQLQHILGVYWGGAATMEILDTYSFYSQIFCSLFTMSKNKKIETELWSRLEEKKKIWDYGISRNWVMEQVKREQKIQGHGTASRLEESQRIWDYGIARS